MYERSSFCHNSYLSLKHRQLMLLGLASQTNTLYHWATVTKFPDAKPLKLVGCFSPWAKKYLKWQFGACRDSSLLCCQNML